ncbi:MAG: thermonuclease family protein [Pseudomonadota bacterium]
MVDLSRFSLTPDHRPWVFDAWLNPHDTSAVYDGDTVRRINIDLGFGVTWELDSARLIGIDAPEVRGPERMDGLKTRDWLRGRLADANHRFLIVSHKGAKGKYGRWLVELFADGVNLNAEMVRLGLAEVNFYD